MRALAFAFLAAPALAQPVPAVEAALDRALSEQALLAACLGLDGPTHEALAQGWAEAVGRTVAALEAGGYDADATARFRERAAPDALAPAPEATYAEVQATCWAKAEEVARLRARWLQTFRPTDLPEALPAPFAP